LESCISCGSSEREALAANRFFPGTDIVCCKGCGLIYSFPRPTPEQTTQFYRESYYNYGSFLGPAVRVLKLYYSGLRARHQYRWIRGAIGAGGTSRVLEVGCGYGRLLELFAGDGWEVWGIEPAEDCARYTARMFPDRPQAIFRGTFEEFEPQTGTLFDLIVLSHVFEHFIAPEKIIERIKEILAPGGRIFFELPNGAAGHYIETRYSLVPDFYFFKDNNFSAFIRKHGLEVEKISHIEYRRLMPRYDNLGHAVNYAWWAVLDLFGISCFRNAETDSIWLRVLVEKPHS
jgi:SAM-dependent methyltransferase